MQKLLTIVVPVYKVEPYINKCLDSLILDDKNLMNQLEVIVVNDGTPDRSAEMSREYVKRFPNTFRQIDKENGGHGSAWNRGLKEATGKYLRFLDSDDWLTNLDKLMFDLQNCEADMVFNSFDQHFVENGRVVTFVIGLPLTGLNTRPIVASEWKNHFNFWTVTYKTDILKPLQPLFAEKVMYDDYIITWASLIYGRTYRTCDYVLYNYLIGRPGQSVSVSKQEKKARSYWSCFQKFEEVRSKIDENAVPQDYLTVIDRCISGYAAYIFVFLAFLPYKESKTKLGYLNSNYLSEKSNSAAFKRYSRLPFWLFYLVERLRLFKTATFKSVREILKNEK